MPEVDSSKFYAKVDNASKSLYKLVDTASSLSNYSLYQSRDDIAYSIRTIIQKYGTLLKFMKSEDFCSNEFGGKTIAALIAFKYKKTDCFNRIIATLKKEEAARKEALQIAEENRKKKMKVARDNQIMAVKMVVPDIHLLNYAATIKLNNGPWLTLKPDLNYDGAIPFENCQDGIYVVQNNLTLYFGTSSHGTYYCGLTTLEKRGTKINILLSHSFYSGLTDISYGKVDGFQEAEMSNDKSSKVIAYSTFMQNNKKTLEEFVAKHVELLDKPIKQEMIYSDN